MCCATTFKSHSYIALTGYLGKASVVKYAAIAARVRILAFLDTLLHVQALVVHQPSISGCKTLVGVSILYYFAVVVSLLAFHRKVCDGLARR